MREKVQLKQAAAELRMVSGCPRNERVSHYWSRQASSQMGARTSPRCSDYARFLFYATLFHWKPTTLLSVRCSELQKHSLRHSQTGLLWRDAMPQRSPRLRGPQNSWILSRSFARRIFWSLSLCSQLKTSFRLLDSISLGSLCYCGQV